MPQRKPPCEWGSTNGFSPNVQDDDDEDDEEDGKPRTKGIQGKEKKQDKKERGKIYTAEERAQYRESLMCKSPSIMAIRRACLQDRHMVDLGMKACMGFIRAYKEHMCSAILKFKKLQWRDVFNAYALLRVPKMPELKHAHMKKKAKLLLQVPSALCPHAPPQPFCNEHYRGGGDFVGRYFRGNIFVLKEGGEIFPWRNVGVFAV